MPQRPIRSVIAKQKVLTATAEITVTAAARLMKKKSVGAVMVVKDNGRLAGIFTERDALFRVLAEGRDPKTTRLSDVMTAQPQTITPEKPFGHALLMMYESGFRHVPFRLATCWARSCRSSSRSCSGARESGKSSGSRATGSMSLSARSRPRLPSRFSGDRESRPPGPSVLLPPGY